MSFPGLTKVEPFGVRIAPDGNVHLSPGLASWAVTDSNGVRVATIHGAILKNWAGPGLTVTDSEVRADFPIDSEFLFVRRVMHQLHGIHLAVTQGPLGRHLHLDFGGAIPAVWDTETGAVGASADQVLDDAAYQDRFLADRYRRMVETEGKGWITGTLTAHRGVRRLLPGHALDLETLKPRRTWPLEGDIAVDLPVAQAAARAADAIRGYVEGAARDAPTAITLTAGFDSRMLLAGARHVGTDVQLVTFGNAGDGLDQDLSVRMARELGLSHRLIPIVEATEADRTRWDRLVGHCMREENRRTHPTLGEVDAHFVLTGVYGEVGRNRFFRHGGDTLDTLGATPELICGRLTIPAEPEQLADIAEWLAEVAWMPKSMLLDLAYNELRFGTWAMGQSAAQKAVRFTLMPFAQAAVQTAFMRCAPEDRVSEELFRRMGEHLWPQAMRFPVNRYGDWRDRFGKLAKLTSPEKVKRYLRGRFGG